MNKSKNYNPELSFSEYCLQNDIQLIKQDKLIPDKKKSTKNVRVSSMNTNTNELSLLGDFECSREFCNDGQAHLIKSLRQGKFRIIATLDLHNHKQSDAISALEKFTETAITVGDTCVRIIHGKGLNSPENKSILKSLVRRFLEHYPRLLAYASAAANSGGDGVTLVKLKK